MHIIRSTTDTSAPRARLAAEQGEVALLAPDEAHHPLLRHALEHAGVARGHGRGHREHRQDVQDLARPRKDL